MTITVKDPMLKSEWNPCRLPMSIEAAGRESTLNQPLLIITAEMGFGAGSVGLFF